MSESFVGALSSAIPMAASPTEAAARVLLGAPARVIQSLRAKKALPEGPETIDLSDMTLPDDVRLLIEPVLDEFEMRLESTEKRHPVVSGRMHVAVNGELKVFLLHFNSQVLEDARWAYDVIMRMFLFTNGEHVRILSKDCKGPEPTFAFGWNEWSQRGEIETEYVEWRYFNQLRELSEEKRPDLLRIALKLPSSLKRRSATQEPRHLMEDSARLKELVSLIAGLGQASSMELNAFMNDLLLRSALPQEIRLERASWGDSFPAAARHLVEWLHAKGSNPVQEGYTCLASVLVQLLDTSGIEQRRFLLETLQRYQLVSIASELESLRKQYLDEGDG
jgi:hypothetical protein